MKRKILLTIAVLVALFIPIKRAFLAGSSFASSSTAPVPPIAGRKAESRSLSYLNNSGVSFSTWMSRGKSYIKRKEYEQAILAFRKALRLRPADAECRFLLAWSYEKRGMEGLPGDSTDWDALAEQEYRAAVSLTDHLPARFNLALLYRRNERLDEARMHLEHILLVKPRDLLARKADAELAALFEQSQRPRHIAVELPEAFRDAE